MQSIKAIHIIEATCTRYYVSQHNKKPHKKSVAQIHKNIARLRAYVHDFGYTTSTPPGIEISKCIEQKQLERLNRTMERIRHRLYSCQYKTVMYLPNYNR